MNREKKFRVYDSISNVMWDYDTIKNNKFSDFDLEHYTLIQYTGLKDKNGVEIYEGDQFKIGGEIQTVTFSNGCYFVGAIVLAMTCGHREIIGNIHEQS